MKEFFLSFTLNEGLTIGISILAFAISVISFINSAARDKRQLRIGRIEEIIEIIHVLMGNYRYYEDTFHLQQTIRNESDKNETDKKRLEEIERKQVEGLEKFLWI